MMILRRAGTFDFRTHRYEKIGEVLDFRFLSCAVDDGRPLGKHGSHHDVVGAQDGGAELPAQVDGRATELRGEHFHVAALNANGCAQASNPRKCKSMGRSPMTQPPGSETVASFSRPKSGPRTQMEARIFRTIS